MTKQKWKYFSIEGDPMLACPCCGEVPDTKEFNRLMSELDILRESVGFPLRVTSGYRCANHPIERKKSKPGQHNIAAVDLGVSREKAHTVLRHALLLGFRGIGVNQKGDGRFIHLDLREHPTVWSY